MSTLNRLSHAAIAAIACHTEDFVSKYPPSYYHRDPARADFIVSIREAANLLEIQHKINFASMEKDAVREMAPNHLKYGAIWGKGHK